VIDVTNNESQDKAKPEPLIEVKSEHSNEVNDDNQIAKDEPQPNPSEIENPENEPVKSKMEAIPQERNHISEKSSDSKDHPEQTTPLDQSTPEKEESQEDELSNKIRKDESFSDYDSIAKIPENDVSDEIKEEP
jgi:hypothetical protein